MANMQALLDLREFAQDLVENLPEHLYDQDKIETANAQYFDRATCGCLMHHLTHVSGDRYSSPAIMAMTDIPLAMVWYIAGTPAEICDNALFYNYPYPKGFGTSGLVDRIDFIIEEVKRQDEHK